MNFVTFQNLEWRYLKGGEYAWAVESRPDFSVMENNRIVAVFDAKNYGAFSSTGEATHKMLAYMANLDCGFGGLFFPRFNTAEYKFPRENDNLFIVSTYCLDIII